MENLSGVGGGERLLQVFLVGRYEWLRRLRLLRDRPMGPVHLRRSQGQRGDRAYRQRLRHQHRTVVAGLSVHRGRRESRRGFGVRAVIHLWR